MSSQLTPETMEQRIIDAVANDESIPQRKRDRAIANQSESKWTSYEHVSVIAEEYVSLGVIKPGDTVLDVGSGHGLIALPLIEMGCKYIGLEVSKPCIERARKVFAGVDNIEFHHLDVRSDQYSNPTGTSSETQITFPLGEETVDSIIARSLFTHFESISGVSAYLREMNRCLKQNGVLYSTFFTNPPNEPYEKTDRRVFKKDEIETVFHFSEFELITNWGGTTTDRDDQWKTIARKN